ncbi:class I SAM-dependent methyltransferase [Trabulsiella odontotermitis]|uniref:class I SAM-dependent methyltransferase n=1 Tax=Trabulsiella odontotermitis TaxID=379893 RepID=UPI0006BA426A|nr:class I SAM-dependent methyltransferase [Trabulsiella odontotermitis]
MNTDTNDIFNSEFSHRYDASNSRFSAINGNLHFLITLLLSDLPIDAHILCVGVGTGTEIIYLASMNPDWRFTGIDPSPDMLEVCASKLEQAEIKHRCTLIEGYLENVPDTKVYDAIICLLVTHFIQLNDRGGIYHQMAARLRTPGRLVVAEIAGNIDADNFDEQLANWAIMQAISNPNMPTLDDLRNLLKKRLLLLPPEKTEKLIINAGFLPPYHFFQSLLIHAWVAKK